MLSSECFTPVDVGIFGIGYVFSLIFFNLLRIILSLCSLSLSTHEVVHTVDVYAHICNLLNELLQSCLVDLVVVFEEFEEVALVDMVVVLRQAGV